MQGYVALYCITCILCSRCVIVTYAVRFKGSMNVCRAHIFGVQFFVCLFTIPFPLFLISTPCNFVLVFYLHIIHIKDSIVYLMLSPSVEFLQYFLDSPVRRSFRLYPLLFLFLFTLYLHYFSLSTSQSFLEEARMSTRICRWELDPSFAVQNKDCSRTRMPAKHLKEMYSIAVRSHEVYITFRLQMCQRSVVDQNSL
jgi:hypothetical protein